MSKPTCREYSFSNSIPKRLVNSLVSIRYGMKPNTKSRLSSSKKIFSSNQLYIKARGLTDAIRKRFQSAIPNLSNKVRSLLDTLNLPVVATSPLHLEVIVQIEGKSVVSYFLNEKTFANLTDSDREYTKKMFSYSKIVNVFLFHSPESYKLRTAIEQPH